MKPWGAASSRPDDETLIEMRTTMTQREIAERYGVTPQAVQQWLRSAGVQPTPRIRSHKNVLPWEVRGEDHHDSVARALRFWNRHQQGEQLNRPQEREMRRLIDYLDEEQMVVDYDRERGFLLRPRDADLDAPGDYIRRPVEPAQTGALRKP